MQPSAKALGKRRVMVEKDLRFEEEDSLDPEEDSLEAFRQLRWLTRRHYDEKNIIPPAEDMRLLFKECEIGMGNATLLSQALAMATPEDLGHPVITEFQKKCTDSQVLISARIPWASGKEDLLADLVAANNKLLEALKLYDRRVATQRDRSRKENKDEWPAALWQHMHHPVQTFVYDAAAERTQARIREGHALVVNRVH
ncbi:hypothetical protein C8R44DRAFT_4134 [Mycena epipterygia]|nr:hypothetical protein C8R44DRAFT_4134 [Mycena epipterygia]